jgi:hypothetical protein
MIRKSSRNLGGARGGQQAGAASKNSLQPGHAETPRQGPTMLPVRKWELPGGQLSRTGDHMKRALLFAFALLVAGLLCVVQQTNAQLATTGAGKAPGFFTPSCTQSSNFLARTSGLSTPSKTLYDTLICGL